MRGFSRSRKRRALEGVNLLDICPAREAEWTEREGLLVLTRRHPRERGRRGIKARIDHWLGAPRVKLDRDGSYAWLQFDGRTTVGEIAEAMRREFGVEAEPAEQRLGSFVRLLHREGLISYVGLDR